MIETLAHGLLICEYSVRVMNTNMTGFGWYSKIYASLCLGESSLSIGRVKRKKVFLMEKHYLSLFHLKITGTQLELLKKTKDMYIPNPLERNCIRMG